MGWLRLSRKGRDGDACDGRDGGACDGGEELAVGTVAACLEAAYDAAEVFFHLLFDEDDAVEMVGHHLEGNDFDLGVVAGNAPPFVMDTLTEGREFHPWGIGAVKWRIASSHHLPKLIRRSRRGASVFVLRCRCSRVAAGGI